MTFLGSSPGTALSKGHASHTAVARLQELVDANRLTETALAELFVDEPAAVSVLNHLFVTPAGAGFRDGRELPAEGPLDRKAANAASSVAIELGLARILQPGARVADLYRIGAIALDSRRRGFRRRDDLSSFVEVLIDSAMEEAQASAGLRLERVPAAAQPDALREKAREIVAAEGQPVAAIVTVFQSSSGGRQQRDLAFTYPRLQEELDGVSDCTDPHRGRPRAR